MSEIEKQLSDIADYIAYNDLPMQHQSAISIHLDNIRAQLAAAPAPTPQPVAQEPDAVDVPTVASMRWTMRQIARLDPHASAGTAVFMANQALAAPWPDDATHSAPVAAQEPTDFAAMIYRHLGIKIETSPDEYYAALDLCIAVDEHSAPVAAQGERQPGICPNCKQHALLFWNCTYCGHSPAKSA